MNYEKTETLEINLNTKIFVKNKNNCIYNIGVIVNDQLAFTNETLICNLIEQVNNQTVNGFFSLKDSQLVYRIVVKEKVSSSMLQKYINNAIASVSSFMDTLEVLNNG